MKYCCACENFGPRSGSEDGPISTLCQPGVFSSAIRRQQFERSFWAYPEIPRQNMVIHGEEVRNGWGVLRGRRRRGEAAHWLT